MRERSPVTNPRACHVLHREAGFQELWLDDDLNRNLRAAPVPEEGAHFYTCSSPPQLCTVTMLQNSSTECLPRQRRFFLAVLRQWVVISLECKSRLLKIKNLVCYLVSVAPCCLSRFCAFAKDALVSFCGSRKSLFLQPGGHVDWAVAQAMHDFYSFVQTCACGRNTSRGTTEE